MKKLLKKRILPFLILLLITPIVVPLGLLSVFILAITLVFSAFACLFVGADVVKITVDKINKNLEE